MAIHCRAAKDILRGTIWILRKFVKTKQNEVKLFKILQDRSKTNVFVSNWVKEEKRKYDKTVNTGALLIAQIHGYLLGLKSIKTLIVGLSWYFYTCMGPRNRFQGLNSASLCSLAGRYDNPLPLRFLAPIASLKIPTLIFLFLRIK